MQRESTHARRVVPHGDIGINGPPAYAIALQKDALPSFSVSKLIGLRG